MSLEAARILEEAMKLPDEQRAELAAILADSLGEGFSESEIEAAWIEEAKWRLEDIRAGTTKTTPFAEVDRKLRAMLVAS